MNITAIVPAAGQSSRMGRLKALMPLGHGSVLSCVVEALRTAGVIDIIVVTGHAAEDIEQAAWGVHAHTAHNPDHAHGMFSSITAGMDALPTDVDGFLVLPVDIPLVRSESIRALLEDFDRAHAPVTYPTFRGERGHPPLIRADLRDAILAHDGANGLRGALERFDAQANDIAVPDSGILLDLDTPADYVAARNLAQHRATPTTDECLALWDMADTAPDTREHCRVVAQAARIMAEALNRTRRDAPPLDTEMAHAAALLHDLAKGRHHHEAAGAELLKTWGFDAIAEIVGAHRDISLPEDAPITEREIVFLADKFVSGTRIVTINERYGERLRQWLRDPAASRAIRERLSRARALCTRFETEARVHMPDLLIEAIPELEG
ncbi:CTP:molybdopterin cytidylyltransferase MocA [Desulfobaculum xiamenense]|uniref:CTP:molybdopterin cytidylyltransferase MocA n=1 Tax=Desulfobaculum xiamenense TaxID=995050 RepID=A0A846QP26_9BACT|nr:CTP:molybdopterin cytidylyltransferase MocA [Desulfobaculum xiamenense]